VHGSYDAEIVKLFPDASSESWRVGHSQVVRGLAYDGRAGVWVALQPLFGGEITLRRVGA
jgi:hypothetical protein